MDKPVRLGFLKPADRYSLARHLAVRQLMIWIRATICTANRVRLRTIDGIELFF
jgi:hypothetical protein